MDRTIDISENLDALNPWIRKSIRLFEEENYLDQLLQVYPFQVAIPERLPQDLRRNIIMAHNNRNTEALINLLSSVTKFPYEDPIWYLIKNIHGCRENNPEQIARIAASLYAMSAEETVVRLEAAPKINTQMGPMFTAWVRRNFNLLPLDRFVESQEGIHVLDSTEIAAQQFLIERLNVRDLPKRPDLVAKAGTQYVIGEAKWIGQPGGNQEKQTREIIHFCGMQRGEVIRIGIVDGFPWALKNINGRFVNSKEAVNIQEAEYNIMSALFVQDFLDQYV